MTEQFAINDYGFHVTFENGWTFSVQFGPHTYTEHRNCARAYCKDNPRKSDNCECWAWKGELVDPPPSGYLTPTQMLKYMNEVASRK